MALSTATWAEIRRLYAAGEATARLAERFRVTRKTIVARAKKEGGAISVPAAAIKAPGWREAVATPDQSAVLIRRLYRAISLKLEHMETRMANGETRSAQDEERESRALATMI